jgi:hypothetical protein
MWSYLDGDPIPIQNPPAWVQTFLDNRSALVFNHYVVAKLTGGWLVDVLAFDNAAGQAIAAVVVANPSLGMKWWQAQDTLDAWQVLVADSASVAIAQGGMLYPTQVMQTFNGQQVMVTVNISWAAAIAQGLTIDPAKLIEPHHWSGW